MPHRRRWWTDTRPASYDLPSPDFTFLLSSGTPLVVQARPDEVKAALAK